MDLFLLRTSSVLSERVRTCLHEGWSENTPVFSGDGRWIYFSSARRQSYPKEFERVCHSICRVGFDAENARFNTEIDTLVHAGQTPSFSATWPRPSYDGRYLIYTKINYGYFSIWHPEADLWLLDLNTGESRPIDEVNSDRAESQSKWSTDSRWFLFTSRRDDGLYTRIYFAHIDEDGKVSKPFMLPQSNPKRYYRKLLNSYNTPDFATRPIQIDVRNMGNRIEAPQRVETKVK